jgi:diguanylate cyclase (GGDEF)-like protein
MSQGSSGPFPLHSSSDATRFFVEIASEADFAYQPIITTSSLRVHGFEALARLPAGSYPGVCDLLDHAHGAGALKKVEQVLLRKAIGKFAGFAGATSARLFCNLDNRSYNGAAPATSAMEDVISNSGLPANNLCLEISERTPIDSSANLQKVVNFLTGRNVRIALDDFGVGMSGLHMLMTVEPHYVKIDRCFIHGLSGNARKQAIVAKLCGLAHALGFLTVAEGIESESDFRMARDLGCDLAQGYRIARPTVKLDELSMSYGSALLPSDTRHMSPRVAELLSPISPLYQDDALQTAANLFKESPGLRLVPVVDRAEMVRGALFEEDVRAYLLSDFGPSLLANRGVDSRLAKLIRRSPIGEAYGSIDAIVNSYVAAESSNGLILAHEGRYLGYLSNHAVLRLAAEREVAVAREQNPLTQLPGNHSIARHIDGLLTTAGTQTLAFFDFDHFKAFNDSYGFAAGDRALLMFADLLRKRERSHGAFVAHIGGDDFFMSLAIDEEKAEEVIRDLCAKFARDAESLYSATDRTRGGIVALDRFGAERLFPLLRASASVLHLPFARAHLTQEMVDSQLAAGKLVAKRALAGFAVNRLPATGVAAGIERIGREAA